MGYARYPVSGLICSYSNIQLAPLSFVHWLLSVYLFQILKHNNVTHFEHFIVNYNFSSLLSYVVIKVSYRF